MDIQLRPAGLSYIKQRLVEAHEELVPSFASEITVKMAELV